MPELVDYKLIKCACLQNARFCPHILLKTPVHNGSVCSVHWTYECAVEVSSVVSQRGLWIRIYRSFITSLRSLRTNPVYRTNCVSHTTHRLSRWALFFVIVIIYFFLSFLLIIFLLLLISFCLFPLVHLSPSSIMVKPYVSWSSITDNYFLCVLNSVPLYTDISQSQLNHISRPLCYCVLTICYYNNRIMRWSIFDG